MHPPRLLFAALFCFALGPAVAQEGGDDSGIDVSGEEKPGEEKPAPPDDGHDEEETKKKNVGLAGGGEQDDGHDDEEETKKKNVGLAGGGEQDDGDAGAPKVKADLQTRINEAIKNGVEALKKLQKPDGSWGPVRANSKYDDPKARGDFVRDELGPTAWSIYTLAKCGVKKTDPVIQKGLKYLEKNTEFVFDVMGGQPEQDPATNEQKNVSRKNPRTLTTYESAAIVLMIEAVYEGSGKLTGKHTKRKLVTDSPTSAPDGSKIPKDTWKLMHERIVSLTVGRRASKNKGGISINGQQNLPENGQKGGRNDGGWRYGQANGDADLSATQFVLLGLRAASQAGYPIEKVSPNTWALAAQYVKACQKGDGGFGYQVGGPSYASMTACGIGCLLICKEQMELSAERKPPEWIDGAIKAGMDWLDKNFAAETNSGAERQELFYYLYGVERVGDLSGRKEFNGKDWYLRGAMLLLERQEADGKWTDATGFPPTDVLGTCFALLFLKRATPPVVTFREPGPGE